jgi:hypothetical protein
MAFEKGNHEARPINYQFGKSKTKGTEQVSITFQFVGGPNDGKRMTYNGWLTEKTVERTLETLEHCGWDGVDIKAMKGFGSKNVELVIDEEAGTDGNMYPTIKWVNKLFSRGPGVVYGDEEMDGLAARLAQVNAARRRKLAEAESEPDPFGNG